MGRDFGIVQFSPLEGKVVSCSPEKVCEAYDFIHSKSRDDRREPKPVAWGPSEFPKPPWLGPEGRPRTQPTGLSSMAIKRGYGGVD